VKETTFHEHRDGLSGLARTFLGRAPRTRRVLVGTLRAAHLLALAEELTNLKPLIENFSEFVMRLSGLVGARPFRAKVRGGPMIELPFGRGPRLVTTNFALMLRETWGERIYTPPHFEIREGETIVDLGANIGVFTLFAANQDRTGRIVAYEPLTSTSQLLRRNLELNGITNVRVVQKGVLDRKFRGHMYCSKLNLGGHSIFQAMSGPLSVRVEVDFTTLDDVLIENHLDHVDLLKIDCEGSEYKIVRGASSKTLAKVNRLVIELHTTSMAEDDPAQIVDRLSALGFAVRCQKLPSGLGMLWARRAWDS